MTITLSSVNALVEDSNAEEVAEDISVEVVDPEAETVEEDQSK